MGNARLVLGTAQFGLRYGVANDIGQVSFAEAAAVLAQAFKKGIFALDTAIAYGESERRLGEIGVDRWQVTSKLPPLPESCPDIGAWVRESALASRERLKISRLRALLLHHSTDLCGSRGDTLYRALSALKEQGVVEKIGVSIYDPQELDALSPRYRLDVVQAPFNILDRRLATSGWLDRLHRAGKEIQIRSIFLQGLLLMPPANRPSYFARWTPLWDQWHRWLTDQSLTPLQACLGFALSRLEIDRVVVGVNSLTQLDEILANSANGEVSTIGPPGSLISEDPDLVNPARWSIS
jgi:aryl-alcohol dehydrogenase-like predicted oxidoreductase